MKSSGWRTYRGHLIVKTHTPIFGFTRFELWHGRTLVGTFRDVVRAERHVDRLLGGRQQA